MRGMKSLVAPTKRQNFADGGVVGAIKGMFGIKPEDPERARMLAEYKANAAREKEAAKVATAPAPAPAPAITDYAAGSALKRREAAAGLKDGGPVRGPGTGTSDDVPDNVPEGTYIMPADSTQAIGEKTLGGLGMRGIDVNLSNGEFKLPPKQVHAIGVQALNQMKDATHTPSSTEAAKGMKPELFFEGGGVASEEERQRRISQIPVGGNMPAPPADGKNDTEFSRNVNNGLNALGGMGVVASTPLRAPAVAQELRGAYQTLTGPAAKAAAPAADFIAGAGPNATAYANTIPRIGNAPTQALPAVNAALQEGAQANVLAAAARTAAGANAAAPDQPANPALAATAQAAPIPATPGGAVFGFYPQLAGGQRTTYATDAKLRTGVQASGPSTFAPATPSERTIIGGGNGQRMNAAQDPRSLTYGATAGNDTEAPVAPAAPNPTDQRIAAGAQQAPAAATQPASAMVAPGAYRNAPGQYSDNAAGMAMPAGFTGQPNAQNMAAADALAGRSQQESMNRVTARGMGALAGGPGSGPVEPGSFTGGFSGVIGTDPRIAQQERERSALVSALSSPLRGAQNGQLTASQRQGMAGLLDAERRDASGNRQADQTAATQRDIAAMREAGENGRAFLRDAIDQQRVGVDAQRYGVEAQAKGLDIRAAQRRESAYDNYSKAKTDEDRQAIAKQFPDLFGQAKDAAHRMEVVRGKTDPMTGQSSGDYVVVQDPKTGGVRQIQMGAASAAPTQALPKAGEVRNGFRFKGGNPNDQANWTKV